MSRARSLWAFAPLIAFALLVVGAGFMVLKGGARHDLSQEGLIGQPAPLTQLTRLSGGQGSLADFAGRPVLVNAFASWCTPCRVEHPLIRQLAEQRGAEIVGLAYKDKPDHARGYLEELGDPYAVVLLDPDGRYGLQLGLAGVPETFVINAGGIIRAIHRGPLTQAVIAEKIAPALVAGQVDQGGASGEQTSPPKTR